MIQILITQNPQIAKILVTLIKTMMVKIKQINATFFIQRKWKIKDTYNLKPNQDK